MTLRALRHGRRLRILTEKLCSSQTVRLIDRGDIVATIFPVASGWREDCAFDNARAAQDTIDPARAARPQN